MARVYDETKDDGKTPIAFEEDAPPPRLVTLPLGEIKEDAETQPREIVNAATVHDYAELMRAGVTFPPLDVFHVDGAHLLADGYQRLAAARKAGLKTVEVRVHAGTRRDAILFAATANARHGLPLSNSDKRRVVKRLLADEEWRGWSSYSIAKHCGCGHKLVDTIRGELSASLAPGASEPVRKYTNKHGTDAEMKTGNIGKKGSESTSDNVVRITAKRENTSETIPAIRITRKPEDAPEIKQLTSAEIRAAGDKVKIDLAIEGLVRAVQVDPTHLASVLRDREIRFEGLGGWLKHLFAALDYETVNLPVAEVTALIVLVKFLLARIPERQTNGSGGDVNIPIDPADVAEFDCLLDRANAVLEGRP